MTGFALTNKTYILNLNMADTRNLNSLLIKKWKKTSGLTLFTYLISTGTTTGWGKGWNFNYMLNYKDSLYNDYDSVSELFQNKIHMFEKCHLI